jgi:hypothetical protein
MLFDCSTVILLAKIRDELGKNQFTLANMNDLNEMAWLYCMLECRYKNCWIAKVRLCEVP